MVTFLEHYSFALVPKQNEWIFHERMSDSELLTAQFIERCRCRRRCRCRTRCCRFSETPTDELTYIESESFRGENSIYHCERVSALLFKQ